MKKKRHRKKEIKQAKLICIIGVLVAIILLLLLFRLLFGNREIYKIESRTNNIAKVVKTDTSDYDTIAWLRVQGTNIDYPVILGKQKEFQYPVQQKKYAWLMGNDKEFHNKINIMGHNIFNLSSHPKKHSDDFDRFEELMAFVYEDFAKENKYIQLTMNGKDYVYKIFSAGFTSSSSMILLPDGENDADDINKQLKLFNKISLYDYDVDVKTEDRYISLVTCTRFFENKDTNIYFVVSGRLLRDNEKISDYKVSANANYDEIKKILESDVNEDESV